MIETHTYKHTYIQGENNIHADCTTWSAWIITTP